jgi:hypothetical protein
LRSDILPLHRLMEMQVAKLAEVEQEVATVAVKVDRLTAMQAGELAVGTVPAPSMPLLIRSVGPPAPISPAHGAAGFLASLPPSAADSFRGWMESQPFIEQRVSVLADVHSAPTAAPALLPFLRRRPPLWCHYLTPLVVR